MLLRAARRTTARSRQVPPSETASKLLALRVRAAAPDTPRRLACTWVSYATTHPAFWQSQALCAPPRTSMNGVGAMYESGRGPHYDTIEKEIHAASDHAAIYADINL
jgi:hypothetical protein